MHGRNCDVLSVAVSVQYPRVVFVIGLDFIIVSHSQHFLIIGFESEKSHLPDIRGNVIPNSRSPVANRIFNPSAFIWDASIIVI